MYKKLKELTFLFKIMIRCNYFLIFYILFFSRIFLKNVFPINQNEKMGITFLLLIQLIYILYSEYYNIYNLKSKNKITIKKYTNKSFCVFIQNSKYNKQFSKLNGKWENNLYGNKKGWVFPNKDYNKVLSIIN